MDELHVQTSHLATHPKEVNERLKESLPQLNTYLQINHIDTHLPLSLRRLKGYNHCTDIKDTDHYLLYYMVGSLTKL